MIIELNGAPAELPDGASVAQAVAVAATGAEAQRRGVAVAVEGEVVPRGEWDSTSLREGQAVEVVRAIQGG
jgi:sulfur carrier protein